MSEAAAVKEWWQDHALMEAAAVLPKAQEYGNLSLVLLGRALLGCMPQFAEEDKTDDLAQEVACAFYAMGKVGRLFDSFSKGRRPNLDQWFDIGVYSRMAQYIRETGTWVNSPEATNSSASTVGG